MRSFICMWIGELAMNVWMRIDFAGLSASAARRMSFSFARASAHTVLSVIAFAMSCTASKSPFDDAGKPASMTSTRSRSSWRAMRVFSSLRHRCAGALLAVAQRRVENDQVVGHGASPSMHQAATAPGARRGKRILRTAAIHGSDDRLQRRRDDVRVEPDAVDVARARAQLNVGDRRGVFAGARRMLVIREHVHVDAETLAQAVDERIDRPVARAPDQRLDAIDRKARGHLLERALPAGVARPVVDVRDRRIGATYSR